MTSQTENELLTRIGPGTPMGALMRQYWLPACLSSELKADGDPLRLMLLGEKLIAFRDSADRIGVLDHRCPHRCASLFFGRNEEGGLRCVYHGWKFDTAGNCLDMPNLPDDQDFRHKVKAKSYQVSERGGVVYVYMGEREVAPPMPAIEATLCPAAEVTISCVMRECNWLQALEGDIDTSHFSFLHTGKVEFADIDQPSRAVPVDRPRPALPCKDNRLGHDVRRLSSGAAGASLLSVRPFCLSVLDIVPERTSDRQHLDTGLGANGRHACDVVPIQLEA
jgi:phenylpropionate dioxygenase-like ring-hydroxylating dioxygenase large terminal subunit